MERRQNWLSGLGLTILLVLICLLVAIPLALDRLGDRLTAAMSAEAHNEMRQQIRANHIEQSEERRMLEAQLREVMDTQKVYIDTWREKVIRQHPDLGEKK